MIEYDAHLGFFFLLLPCYSVRVAFTYVCLEVFLCAQVQSVCNFLGKSYLSSSWGTKWESMPVLEIALRGTSVEPNSLLIKVIIPERSRGLSSCDSAAYLSFYNTFIYVKYVYTLFMCLKNWMNFFCVFIGTLGIHPLFFKHFNNI